MKHLWSPWRMKYIRSQERETGCIFCKAVSLDDGVENLIVHRGPLGFVILNRFPYTSGHAMVVPYCHECSFEDLSPETRSEMMELITLTTRVLRETFCPDGFNVGTNIGAAAGAGITTHVHFHVVPRWGGDANFMSTVADIRVIPEDLAESYKRVKAEFEKITKK